MAATDPTEATLFARRPLLATAGVLVCLLGLAALIGHFVYQVSAQLEAYRTANTDNAEWGLAQTEVEFKEFLLALDTASDAPSAEALADLRRSFDVAYSRLDSIETAGMFAPLRARPAYGDLYGEVARFMQSTVPLVDGPSDALAASLPSLERRALATADTVRQLSLLGLRTFVAEREIGRQALAGTLLRVAMVLVALILMLMFVAGTLLRLWRLAQARAREVREAGARMNTIVETAHDAIVVCDPSGRIVDANGTAARLFGYRLDEMRGACAVRLLAPDENSETLLSGTLSFMAQGRRPSPAERRFELAARARNGRRFPVEVSVDRADGNAGGIYVAFLRDIAKRKADEEELRDARDRALAGERAKAEFLAVMSHEMRTPLNGLLGAVQLLRAQEPLSGRQSALVETMETSGDVLLDLINDVLDLSAFEAGKLPLDPRPLDLARLLDGVVETTMPLARRNGNALRWTRVGDGPMRVVGDARRLRQILLNLVGNAVKFTRDGHVEIEVETLGGARPTTEFRVLDTGVGIAASEIGRIFDDFEMVGTAYDRGAGGTGLGLGITRRLVSLMGGEIGVESELGEGSLFWVRVPLPTDRSAPKGVDAPSQAPRAVRPLSVLVVEDNEINRMIARSMLEADGHEVCEATDGAAGVSAAEARAFDVILMDISMPVMNGVEAARRIRGGTGRSRAAPIVAATAHALTEEIERFREAGMAFYVLKPLDRETLSRVLSQAVGERDETAPRRAVRGPAVLEAGQLDALQVALEPSDLERLTELFVAECAEVIGRLKDGDLDAGDQAILAHKLAGSCASFGLAEMRAELVRIETAAREGADASSEIARLDAHWSRGRDALDAALSARGLAPASA